MTALQPWLLRMAYLLTWIVYGLVIAYLDWSKSDSLGLVMGAFGVLGLVAATAGIKVKKWHVLYLWLSVVLVALYLVRWVEQIESRHAADASLGWAREIFVQGQMWKAIIDARLSQGSYVDAAVEAYWLFGMVLLQVVLIFVVLINRPSRLDGGNQLARS